MMLEPMLSLQHRGIRRVRHLALGCESNWVKSTHDAYENTWKCGERFIFPHPPEDEKKKKNACHSISTRINKLLYLFSCTLIHSNQSRREPSRVLPVRPTPMTPNLHKRDGRQTPVIYVCDFWCRWTIAVEWANHTQSSALIVCAMRGFQFVNELTVVSIHNKIIYISILTVTWRDWRIISGLLTVRRYYLVTELILYLLKPRVATHRAWTLSKKWWNIVVVISIAIAAGS